VLSYGISTPWCARGVGYKSCFAREECTMAQTPDPDGLMQQFYPLLGGKANVVKESRQSSCLLFSIKDQSLADTAALAALPTVASCSLRGGRVRVELEAKTYEKAIKE